MPVSDEPRWLRPGLLLEIFVLLNLGFLTFDIYLAHSVNGFRQRAEYIPLYFSALAPIFILAGLAFQGRMPWLWKALGHVIGWSAILIGLTGVVLHLDSSFFYERTIRSLTYSAPFAAPLAYTGPGFLLLLNRLEEPNGEEWARWVLFMAKLEWAFGALYCMLNGIWPGRRSMPSIISSMAPHPWPHFCFRILWR